MYDEILKDCVNNFSYSQMGKHQQTINNKTVAQAIVTIEYWHPTTGVTRKYTLPFDSCIIDYIEIYRNSNAYPKAKLVWRTNLFSTTTASVYTMRKVTKKDGTESTADSIQGLGTSADTQTVHNWPNGTSVAWFTTED